MIKKTSLRFRLMAANILVKQVVILLAGIFLLNAFETLFRQHLSRELKAEADRLAAQQITAEEQTVGALTSNATHLWQITRNGVHSAGNTDIKTSNEARANTGDFFAVTRTHDFDPAVVVTVAVEESYISGVKNQFRNSLILALGGIAALLLTSAWIQMNLGLRPAEMLRKSIERVRMGLDKRIGSGFPEELEPLINETNRLLEAQEVAVQRARARAGDLAHGLKTPLTAMSVMNEQLRETGATDLADDIAKQLETMSRHVYRELTRTRIAAGSGLSFNTNIFDVIESVRPTIERLPRSEDLIWKIETDPAAAAAIEEDDAVELLANLLDNARKWARSVVKLKTTMSDNLLIVSIEDDGPGVPEEQRDRILDRGARLDENVPGTGLGLTIVKDIVDAYGGGLDIYRADTGGLGIRLTLPAPGVGVRADVRLDAHDQKRTLPSKSKYEAGSTEAFQSQLASI